jgi:type VI secretion system secreted protein VgrG
VKVGTGQFVEAGNEIHYYAGSKVVIDAGMELTASGGGSFLKLDPSGVTLSGATIKMNSGGAPGVGTGIGILPAITPAAAAMALAGNLLKGPAANTLMPPPKTLKLVETLEEEEEEEELEEETPVGITLRIGVFFDGTGNNKNNSETVAGCFAKDVNLEEAAEDIRAHCAAFGYDGKGSSPDNSYGNDTSNVARLFDLYMDHSFEALPSDAQEAYLRIYVEGIGTSSGQPDSVYSQGTGRGEMGVVARVEQSPALITDKIRLFNSNNPELLIERIEFDIFGFSRGAAAARHFANEVLKGEQSILAPVLPAGSPSLVSDFAWRSKTDVAINFIGLFDTVAATVDLLQGDFSGHNAENPGVNLQLPQDAAKKVVHLVAGDEVRYNFALNGLGGADIALPGVHSDIGGGYLPRATEKLLLSKPRSSLVDRGKAPLQTLAYLRTHQELQDRLERLRTYGLQLGITTWEVNLPYRRKQDMYPEKRVYAAVSSERQVFGDLALIYLRIMRELAVRGGVPLRPISDKDPQLALPGELQPIAEKLMAYALGESASTGLTEAEKALLYRRYIHLSAHWNAAKNWNSSALDIVFINHPTDDYKRVVHPNE